jgi:hypothetical protein
MRIAVIGDVGGHLGELRTEVERLGVDADRRMPDDLVIVQVGDLIHRGPDSDAVVAYVDGLLRYNPGRWIQLVGNHEANYIRPPVFKWSQKVSRAAARTLRAWWRDGTMRVAASVETAGESFLITHAGLTAQFWSNNIGAPAAAGAAAVAINKLAHEHSDAPFRTGLMISGRVHHGVGPVWADSARELVPSWADRVLPFSQIHGHSSVVSWDDEGTGPEIGGALLSLNGPARHATAWLPGGRLIGIDPGHGGLPAPGWQSLVLDGDLGPS